MAGPEPSLRIFPLILRQSQRSGFLAAGNMQETYSIASAFSAEKVPQADPKETPQSPLLTALRLLPALGTSTEKCFSLLSPSSSEPQPPPTQTHTHVHAHACMQVIRCIEKEPKCHTSRILIMVKPAGARVLGCFLSLSAAIPTCFAFLLTHDLVMLFLLWINMHFIFYSVVLSFLNMVSDINIWLITGSPPT